MFKLLSLFSGVGAFEKAFEYLNLEYELVNYCEIDKYASKSYALIHHVPESMNLGDITKVDTSKLPRDIDLITYGFPCQDISAAGKLRGFVDESGNVTRSGLFFEALRIIEDTKPKIAIAENVKNLVSKKFKTEFTAVLNSLNEAGYNCYWQVLNAKDYGIPQNRERVFIVSIRKDIDNRTFTFPKPFELSIRLRDVLEDEVDESFFLTPTLDTRCDCLGVVVQEPKVVGGIGEKKSNGGTQWYEQDRIYDDNIATAISANHSFHPNYATNLRIRKLTPKECFRLMGFKDYDIDTLLNSGVSNTQLYKQAGNSIVINVIEQILAALFELPLETFTKQVSVFED